jgi:hypothetical protein
MHQSKSPGVQAGVIRERPTPAGPEMGTKLEDTLPGLLRLASSLSQAAQ